MKQHHVNICQYGYVHGQCRCASPTKTIRRVECSNIKHAQHPSIGGKHRRDTDSTGQAS